MTCIDQYLYSFHMTLLKQLLSCNLILNRSGDISITHGRKMDTTGLRWNFALKKFGLEFFNNQFHFEVFYYWKTSLKCKNLMLKRKTYYVFVIFEQICYSKELPNTQRLCRYFLGSKFHINPFQNDSKGCSYLDNTWYL